MVLERYFLTQPDSVARVPTEPQAKITAIAYPITDVVYILHQGPVSEALVASDELILTEPQGRRCVLLQSKKPVFVWCRDRSGKIWGSKIYSVVQSSMLEATQFEPQPSA